MAKSIHQSLQKASGRNDWTEIDGPQSSCGVDHWFVNDNGEIAYVNDDQGHLTIQLEAEEV